MAFFTIIVCKTDETLRDNFYSGSTRSIVEKNCSVVMC